MNGDVYITLSTPKIVYKMHFDRNISIIRGDIGTGKSLLCELISLALAGDETVTLSTNGPKCIVMPLNTSDPTSKSWKDIISDSTDSVIFVDEMCDCFHANEFYTSIQYTSNYFVLLTRRDYSNISYSPKAIFEFKKEMGEFKPTIFNECLYPVMHENITPTKDNHRRHFSKEGSMLRIHFGPLEGQIKRPDTYLDNTFDPEWFQDPFVKEICKGIDGTIAHSAYQMENPIFGPINVRMLSTGCKNTILAYETDRIIPATHMGDNCAPFVWEIAKRKDLTITLEYVMDFSKCEGFSAFIMNSNKMVNSYEDYLFEAIDYL